DRKLAARDTDPRAVPDAERQAADPGGALIHGELIAGAGQQRRRADQVDCQHAAPQPPENAEAARDAGRGDPPRARAPAPAGAAASARPMSGTAPRMATS